MAKYVEIIKWNWQGEKDVEDNSVYFFDNFEDALREYHSDIADLRHTDAEVYICEFLNIGGKNENV